MAELNDKLDLLSYLMRNGPTQRSVLISKFTVSSRTVDRYTSELIQKYFLIKDVVGRDPIYSVNWDYFDCLSTQKKPEYRRGNIDDILDKLE